jgi:hypothetical protein
MNETELGKVVCSLVTTIRETYGLKANTPLEAGLEKELKNFARTILKMAKEQQEPARFS